MDLYPKGVHDFLWVNDFVHAILLVLNAQDCPNELVIGTGVETTNKEVAQLVEKISGKKLHTRFEEMQIQINTTGRIGV